MRTSEITPEDIIRLLNTNSFADLVGNELVEAAPQIQLMRALTLACECGHIDLVKELHGRGVDFCKSAEPLNAAADHDRLEVARYLIDLAAC